MGENPVVVLAFFFSFFSLKEGPRAKDGDGEGDSGGGGGGGGDGGFSEIGLLCFDG